MASPTIVWDSRTRSVLVMVFAWVALIWVASAFVSDNMLEAVGVLGVFLVLVLFSVFVRTIRFEAAALCALLVGYLVGNRGFAELAPVKPVYPGEMGMIVIFAALLVRYAISREVPDLRGWIGKMIIIFCAMGAAHLFFDYRIYHLDAVRDSAMVYYSVYYFLGRHLFAQPAAKKMLEWALKFSFVALVPIAFMERFFPEVNWLGGEGGLTLGLLYQKDDLMTTFAVLAVFMLYTRPKMFRWGWIRVAMIIFYLVLVFSGMGRAAVAALLVASMLLLVAGRTRFVIYPILALVLGVTVLTGFAVTIGTADTGSVDAQIDKFASMMDFGSTARYRSDVGTQKAGTNDFRRKLWDTFIDETNATAPVLGRGFGYNFVLDFSDIYRLGEAGNLRSAHNFYITLYGRMGLSGILVFGVLTGMLLRGGLLAATDVRRGRMSEADLSYWIATWVILVSSAVGVVLEGPIGAIVFWTFLGVAVNASEEANEARQALLHETGQRYSWIPLAARQVSTAGLPSRGGAPLVTGRT